MIKGPLAIASSRYARPLIVAVEHLLLPSLLAPLALRLSRPFEQTPPQGTAALRLVFGTDNCINAIPAPKNGSSTATLYDRKETNVAVEDIAKFVKEQVSQCYWKHDRNCATTVLYILSEIFEIQFNKQTFDAALAMHGAGKYGAQCGLVEGTIMFMGVFGRQNNIHDHDTIDACREFARKFESRFGSLLCSMLRPEGFNEDNPLHMCEQITCEAIEFAALHVSSFKRNIKSV